MTKKRLRNWRALLQGIADGVKAHEGVKPASIKIVFLSPTGAYTFGLAQALDVIANDLTWDERGDWEYATEAEVRTI